MYYITYICAVILKHLIITTMKNQEIKQTIEGLQANQSYEFAKSNKVYFNGITYSVYQSGQLVADELNADDAAASIYSQIIAIRSNALQILQETFEETEGTSLKQYVIDSSKADPNFFRWLFNEDLENDFDSSLTDAHKSEFDNFISEI